MAVRDWLQMKDPSFHGDGIFKLVVINDERIDVLRVVVKYRDTSTP